MSSRYAYEYAYASHSVNYMRLMLSSYQDICEDTGIATNILAERLQALTRRGIIKNNLLFISLPQKDALFIRYCLRLWHGATHGMQPKTAPPSI